MTLTLPDGTPVDLGRIRAPGHPLDAMTIQAVLLAVGQVVSSAPNHPMAATAGNLRTLAGDLPVLLAALKILVEERA